MQSGVTESAVDIAYRCENGRTRFGATLVRRVDGLHEPAAVVHVVEAAPPDEEMERLLARQCLLADASVLLNASLDLTATLHAVVRLALPELAECCLVRLFEPGKPAHTSIGHVNAELEQQLVRLGSKLADDDDLSALEGSVLRSEAAYALRSLSSDSGEKTPADDSRRCLSRCLGAKSCLAIPLSARSETIGLLYLVAFAEQSFELRDIEFAQELAQRASTALDNARLLHGARQTSLSEDVLRTVSHDLRSPLGAITMTVQYLLRHIVHGENAPTHKELQLIHRSSAYMERLIEELLEIPSFERGAIALQYSQVSLRSLLQRAQEMFARAACQKGVRVSCRCAAADECFACDAEQMLRVVSNVLGNAIKFTPRGGAVDLAGFVSEGEVHIRVTDTGPGISKDQQPKLFERYWKGDIAANQGVGLGLYIARCIVEAHRGRIWVESEPPAGSSFIVALPLAAPA